MAILTNVLIHNTFVLHNNLLLNIINYLYIARNTLFYILYNICVFVIFMVFFFFFLISSENCNLYSNIIKSLSYKNK